MFFVFALVSTVAYALHNVWMASYYRRIDRMVAVTARGFAMSVAMLPGLAIAGLGEWTEIPEQFPRILAASACALLGNWAGATSVRFLPVGIAAALNMSLSTIVSALLSAWFYDERLSVTHWLWMGAIFGGIFALGASRSPAGPLPQYRMGPGLLCAAVFAVALGTAFTLISGVSRAVHPLTAGFCWETTIALLGAAVVLVRQSLLAIPWQVLTRADCARLLVYAIPGGIGTMCYAMAVAGGPIAVVGAVLSTMMVASSIFAWLIYGERLYATQWILVAVVCGALIGMRVAGG